MRKRIDFIKYRVFENVFNHKVMNGTFTERISDIGASKIYTTYKSFIKENLINEGYNYLFDLCDYGGVNYEDMINCFYAK